MIYSFTFKNFCSFADNATILFEDIRKGVETKSNMFIDNQAGDRLSNPYLCRMAVKLISSTVSYQLDSF